jgi:hypothetical protein
VLLSIFCYRMASLGSIKRLLGNQCSPTLSCTKRWGNRDLIVSDTISIPSCIGVFLPDIMFSSNKEMRVPIYGLTCYSFSRSVKSLL